MVSILLATYNGAKYIGEQIESLLSQTYTDMEILVHDDGSTDATESIIDGFVAMYPEKIKKIEGESTGSAAANFGFLLSKCDSDYIMFCDQDDVWVPEKVETTLGFMRMAEEENSPDTPILVHSDLSVVNSDLEVIDRSFFHFQNLDSSRTSLSHLLVQNCVTGCTVMINRALKVRSGEIPKECAMHDWWLALVAELFGKVVFIDKPLVMYRQHGGNEVGAKNARGLSYIKSKVLNIKKLQENYLKTFVQARLLRQRFIKDGVSPEKQKILNAYCNMSELGKIKRLKLMRQYDFRKNTLLRVIGQYIMM